METGSTELDEETCSINGLEAEFVDVDGTRTRYYEMGEGTPLLLLHGGHLGSGSANTWSLNIEGLAEAFHVFAPDRIGCGMTKNPDSMKEFSFETEREHILNFLDVMGIDRAHLIGQSRGGGLAGVLAVDHPDMFPTLVVPNSRTFAQRTWNDWGQRREILFQNVTRIDDAYHDSPRYVIETDDDYRNLARIFSYTTDHISQEWVEAASYMTTTEKAQRAEEYMNRDGGRGYERYQSSFGDNVTEAHEKIRSGQFDTPTLLYWGFKDPSARIIGGLLLYDLIAEGNPNVRMQIVNNAGHYPYREYPAEFNQTVIDFVNFWG